MAPRYRVVQCFCLGKASWKYKSILDQRKKNFVEGRLSSREYTNAAGENRLSLDVRATRVIILDRRESDSSSSNDYGNDVNEIRSSSETSSNNQNIENQDNGDTVEELPW